MINCNTNSSSYGIEPLCHDSKGGKNERSLNFVAICANTLKQNNEIKTH